MLPGVGPPRSTRRTEPSPNTSRLRGERQDRRTGLELGSRRTLAEALATVTLAVTEPGIDPVDHGFCFRLLVSGLSTAVSGRPGFPGTKRLRSPCPGSQTTPFRSLRCLSRSPTPSNTYRNKRKGLSGAINFAIEMGRLDANPLERISTSPPTLHDRDAQPRTVRTITRAHHCVTAHRNSPGNRASSSVEWSCRDSSGP